MAAKNIPAIGEYSVGLPNQVQFAHVTVGFDTTADVVVGDTAIYTIFEVDRPICVFELWTQTETAFTTSVTMTIGDTTTLDRFIADTTINPAATGAVLIRDTLAVAFLYSAAQDIVVDLNGATVAAGLLNVYIRYAILDD